MVVCICISAFCGSIQAETVMISLLNDSGAEYIGGERNFYASAVVEGAMEVFFRANHIVFDLGLPVEEGEVLPGIQTVVRIARAGGAGYLLDMRVGSPEESSELPEYVTYDFLDLATNLVLISGIMRKEEIDAKVTDPFAVCLLLGEKAASVALLSLE